MQIRPFQTQDQDAVIELWRSCELVMPWNNPQKDIARKMQVNPELFLVGELDGVFIASVMGGYEGHRGWINYLAIAPQHRGRGFGRQIMHRVEQDIAALGCPKINLMVRGTNHDTVAFYRALGYEVEDIVGLGKRLEADI